MNRRVRVATLTFFLALLGCSEGAPATASSSGPATSSARSATSAASAARTGAPTDAAPSVVPVAMPSEVVSCEVAGAHYGGFEPSADQLAIANKAVAPDTCLGASYSENALRACAAKAGKTNFTISIDKLEGSPKGCEVSIAGAQHEGRKWVVFRSAHRDGSRFYATQSVVELTTDGAKLFFDIAKHESLCPSDAGPGEAPQGDDAPKEWAKLPIELQRFMCSRTP